MSEHTNRWLGLVGYEPRSTGRPWPSDMSGGDRLHLHAQVNTAPQPLMAMPLPPSGGQRLGGWLHQASANMIAGLAMSVALTAWAHFNTSPAPSVVVLDGQVRPLEAIKIERTKDLAAALAYSLAQAPSGTQMVRSWYEEGHRVLIGKSREAEPVYVPVPRPGLTGQWWSLVYQGLQRVQLYEVHPPETWDANEIYVHLSHWAQECHVQKESIVMWSTFRPAKSLAKMDQCQGGGTCIILAEECGNAFRDLER